MLACPAGYECEDWEEDEFDEWGDDDDNFSVPKKFSASNKNVDVKTKIEEKDNSGTSIKKTVSWVPNAYRNDETPAFINTGDRLQLTNDFKNSVLLDKAEQVQQFLDNGIEVDLILHVGWTALMYAGNSGSYNAMKVLIDNKADVNFHKDRYSVLMATCASKRAKEDSLLKCVQLLIENEASINEFDRCHTSAMIYASREAKPLIVQYLIEHEANVNKQDNRGYSALTWAAHLGHLRVVQVLLQGGADLNVQSCDGSRPVDVAMAQGKELVVNMLQKYGSGVITSEGLSSIETVNEVELQKDNIAKPHKYGDLEIFLSGLQLSDLISKFHDNNVTFQHFLRLTDNDLLKIGISKLGQRKQILDAIRDTHKKDWEPSSLTSIQYNKTIRCPDAVAMVSNTSKHIAYITCTIGYLSDQFIGNKDILHTGVAGATVTELMTATDEAMSNIKDLYAELRSFNLFLAEASQKENYNPPDFIDFTVELENKIVKKRRKQKLLGLFGIMAVIGITFCNKNKLIKLISLPFQT